MSNYCGGVESDIEKVKRKTNEEFHFWLERKAAEARASEPKKKRTGKRGN